MIINNIKWVEYLIGVVQGDGCITYNYYNAKRYPSGISIAIGYQDECYCQELQRIIHQAFPDQSIKIYKEKVIRLCFFNSKIARYFAQFKQNGHWSIPKLYHPEYYIAGLWDTDGYVGNSKRKALCLSIKKSGNLTPIKGILTSLGFHRVKIKEQHYKNYLGEFDTELIRLHSKANANQFIEKIPLQHPRKKIELEKKCQDFSMVVGRRGHKQMLEEIQLFLTNQQKTSKEIAEYLKKQSPSYITKELLRYFKAGYIKRSKTRNKNGYIYRL